MEKKYIVYMHICPNNKKYVGITYNAKQRWGKNGYGYRNNILFKRAINKYGWENINHKILFENLSLEEAKEKEIELIAKYKTNNPKYGYNISLGGDFTTTGYKFTKKQRENLSKAKTKPVYCVEEDKIYYSGEELRKAGYKSYYKVVSGERKTYKDKHFLNLIDMIKYKNGNLILNNNLKKKVICLETKKIYNSIVQAAKDTNCRENSICECCSNKIKSTNKLHWQYYTNNFDFSKCEEIIIKKKKQNNKRIKKIICVETGEIYESSLEAYKQTNINHILEVCKGERKTAGGYKWQYAKDVVL